MAHTQHSAVQEVTEATFDQRVTGAKGAVLVEFTAQWCPPCRVLAPVLEEFAREQAGKLTVLAYDVDNDTTITSRYGVMGFPTMILFKDGQPVKQVIGARPKSALVRDFGPFLG
jgi:thioredoxin 1